MDNLQRYGTLYRNDEGQAVWRIVKDGRLVAENIASDYDAQFIADAIRA
jgi:hypothetical protein